MENVRRTLAGVALKHSWSFKRKKKKQSGRAEVEMVEETLEKPYLEKPCPPYNRPDLWELTNPPQPPYMGLTRGNCPFADENHSDGEARPSAQEQRLRNNLCWKLE